MHGFGYKHLRSIILRIKKKKKKTRSTIFSNCLYHFIFCHRTTKYFTLSIIITSAYFSNKKKKSSKQHNQYLNKLESHLPELESHSNYIPFFVTQKMTHQGRDESQIRPHLQLHGIAIINGYHKWFISFPKP